MTTKQRITLFVLLLAFCASLGSTMALSLYIGLDLHTSTVQHEQAINVWEDGSFTIYNVTGCIPVMLCSEE